MSRRYRPLILLAIVFGMIGLLPPVSTAGAGGFCSQAGFSDTATTEIGMAEMCFTPTVARIEPGDTVTFHNKDRTLHMVGGVTNVFGDLHTEVPMGASVSYKFNNEGVYPYVCLLHPGMGGAIVVGDGKGKMTTAGAVIVEPPSTTTDEPASPASATETEPAVNDRPTWLLPVAIALGLGVLGLAAIPMKRRGGSKVIATKL
ncbi:MAG TPA: plastocyanin/azurin family copper-binding protein [Actinomycetota bacterium]|nr:plastocyanin/azurin family copper-binding protein [Actinomycetota bacterium]